LIDSVYQAHQLDAKGASMRAEKIRGRG